MMKKNRGVVLSIIVAVMLIAVPITVKVVLDEVYTPSSADIDTGGAFSHRISVDTSEDSTSETDAIPFYEEYMPEIAASVSFLWLTSILLFVGLRKRKNEVD